MQEMKEKIAQLEQNYKFLKEQTGFYSNIPFKFQYFD
jgi:hypothetical protein